MNDVTMEKQELEASRLLLKIQEDTKKAKAEQDQVLAALNADKEQSKTLKAEINQLTNKKAGIEREIATLAPVQEKYEATLDTLNEEIKVVEKQAGDKAGEVKALDKTIENHEATIKKMKVEGKKEVDNALKTERAELTRVTAERDAMAAELEVVTKQLNDLNERKDEVNADIATLEENAADLEKAKDAAAKALKPVEKELKDATDRLNSTKKALSDAQNDLTVARDFTKEEQAKHDVLRATTKQLEADKAKAEKEYETERSKLFNINNRDKHVRQYELHVKKAFEEAGIKYTEFVPE